MFLPVHDFNVFAVVEAGVIFGAAGALLFLRFFVWLFTEKSEHWGDVGSCYFGFATHWDDIFEAVHLKDIPGDDGGDVF